MQSKTGTLGYCVDALILRQLTFPGGQLCFECHTAFLVALYSLRLDDHCYNKRCVHSTPSAISRRSTPVGASSSTRSLASIRSATRDLEWQNFASVNYLAAIFLHHGFRGPAEGYHVITSIMIGAVSWPTPRTAPKELFLTLCVYTFNVR